MDNVDIYIKEKWTGRMRGSGKAAAIIVFTDRASIEHKKTVTVEIKDSTKDRLQLMAVTKALNELKRECSVGIYINNPLFRRAIENGWAITWKENGWRKRNGKQVANEDVWKLLYPLLDKHIVGVMGYIARYDPELEKELED